MIPAHETTGSADGPVIVLAGSLGTTRAMWRPQVQALAARARVVAFDHRGHGASPAPPGPYSLDDLGNDVVSMLDQLELRRVHYAGLSLGGMVGMWLAVNHPHRIDRLALLCTSAYLAPPSMWDERAAQVRSLGTASYVETARARWFTAAFAHRCPDVVAAMLADLAATPAEGYAGCCEAIAGMDLRDDLRRISALTLFIGGEQDPVIPPSEVRSTAAAIPAAELRLVPDAAHLANLEQPHLVTGLLAQHFEIT